MRVISGRAKGTRLIAPRGRGTRPTTDRTKEGIFSRLEHFLFKHGGLSQKRVLDLFAGTGALGIEALSRGAHYGVFVDASKSALDVIRENLKRTRLSQRAEVLKRDLLKTDTVWTKLSQMGGFHVIFADPPYGRGIQGHVMEKVVCHSLLSMGGILVIETEKAGDERSGARAVNQGLVPLGSRVYGETEVFFYRREALS